jgi:Putative zinc-finger
MSHPGFRGPSDVHDECWELLPWLANERLGARETARVEVHLRECAACRDELQLQQRLRKAIREQDAVVLAPQTSLQKLMQRIDAAEATNDELDAAHSVPQAAALPRRWRPDRAGWLAVAAGVQGVAIAALLSALWWQSNEVLNAPRYKTETSIQPVPQGAVIRVVFAERATLDDVKQMLRSIDAQIIAGPSEAGVYTLGLTARHDAGVAAPGSRDDATGDGTSARVDAALARLRANDKVVFSEAAVARTEQQ